MNIIVEKDKLLKTQEPYDYRKSTFLKNLKKKNKEIKDGRTILFMKHQYLKRIVNLFQISIIFCSTIITFFESLKTQIFLSEDLTQIISICLSTYIAISTAVFKFIKIDDKKEEIYKLMQNFNDLENNIMNKIQKVKLLQDKFDDETKFNTKTPYILNALYNSIIQPSVLHQQPYAQTHEGDDPQDKKEPYSPIMEELDKLFDGNQSGEEEPESSRSIFKYDQKSAKLKKLVQLENKVAPAPKMKNKPAKLLRSTSLSTLFESRAQGDESPHDEISSGLSDHNEEDETVSAKVLQQTMKHENFQIYLQILAKYEKEFQKIIQDYENEEIDNKILMATTSFDAILSYNEIIYYNGKIVESMMLENVHKNNRNLLENDPIEELEYCKKRIYDCRDALVKNERNEQRRSNLQKALIILNGNEQSRNHNQGQIEMKEQELRKIEILDERKKNELREKIKHYALRASKLYMEYEELQTDDYCINNFFNNFCLFFSNFCRFCLIMKLYLSLTLKSNKVRNLVSEIKSIANIREEDTEFFYFDDAQDSMYDIEEGNYEYQNTRRVGCTG